jgi:hypothetical protein
LHLAFVFAVACFAVVVVLAVVILVVIPEGDPLLFLPLFVLVVACSCRHPERSERTPVTDHPARTASPFQSGHRLGIAPTPDP